MGAVEIRNRDGVYVAIYENSPRIYSFGLTEEEARINLQYQLEEELDCVDE